MRLLPIDAGRIAFDGADLIAADKATLFKARAGLQMVFQDPSSSLNPRSTIARILEEPLIVHRLGAGAARREQVASMLAQVGLNSDMASRYPDELSGGQRQRVAIARALMLRPKLVVCDEPVSALDVSIRAQIINLLLRLRQTFGVAYLFISHDLSIVRHISQRVAVMYLGRIVETGASETLWRDPRHPYTRTLLAAEPPPDPRLARRSRIAAPALEASDPFNEPGGCAFRPRCPLAVSRCREEVPELRDVGDGREVACHVAAPW
jgi:peptide/nickel transport system ATP-binding protein